MSSHLGWLVWPAVLCCAPPICRAQAVPQEWSESQIVERFLAMSPQARELRARVALTEAEARARSVYSNPMVAYSREGAGYNEFFEATQTLPVNGRIRYLRDAGAAAVSVAGANREAALWMLRSDLRLSFFRMVAAQERMRLLSAGIDEVQRLVGLLRVREDQGEGSRYDRLRAERELPELRTDLTAARSLVAAAAARLSGYLPEGTEVQQVRGQLPVMSDPPDLDDLVRRATAARADYLAEQKNLTRYQLEEQAARRLRIPEPQITAGVKRADVVSGVGPNPFSNVTRTGLAFGFNVPLPVFNDGRYEVARYQAEQEQVNARVSLLARQIRTEIQGARAVVTIRKDALAAYQREMESTGRELTLITQVAYQEGEIGILELLDSLRVTRLSSLRLLDLQAGVKEAFIELERVLGEEL
jgi:cobalt-zinc-cadmium efflux system outer membrane protein